MKNQTNYFIIKRQTKIYKLKQKNQPTIYTFFVQELKEIHIRKSLITSICIIQEKIVHSIKLRTSSRQNILLTKILKVKLICKRCLLTVKQMIDSQNIKTTNQINIITQQNQNSTKIPNNLNQSPINNANFLNNNQNTLICIQMQQSKPLFKFDDFAIVPKQGSQKLPQIVQNEHIAIEDNDKSSINIKQFILQQEEQVILKQYNITTDYQQAIKELSNKIIFLELQYQKLLRQKQTKMANQQQKSIKNQQSSNNENGKHLLKVQKTNSNQLTITNNQEKIINSFRSSEVLSWKVNRTFEYGFNIFKPVVQNSETKNVQQILKQIPKQSRGVDYNSQPHKNRRHEQMKQFSSGQIQNLMIDDDSFTSISKKAQQNNPNIMVKKPQVPQLNLQNILIPSTFTSLQRSSSSLNKQSTTDTLPFISLSKSNLQIIKQSSQFQSLSYNKIIEIMNLQKFTQRLSFKPKHYPSPLSTEKQIKLYGKRIFRLLNQMYEHKLTTKQYNFQSNQQNFNNFNKKLENELEFEANQHYVVYYVRNNKNFVAICYFNHTIYIGQYITQGPHQGLIRQGYGIQYRQNKYIYQGEFFADKKHGYAFINNLSKHQFIYCGYFLDGFMDGNGKQMNQNGQVYIGQYKVGQKDGWGKLIYNQQKNIYYEGQFYDGHKHGKGYQMFQNGDSYTGNYVKDKFQGQGQYKWKNGTIYKGYFSQGLKHGKGTLTFKNGKSFSKNYQYNKQLNIQNSDDKKTIKSSRLSSISQSKTQQKTLIQQKTRKLRSHSKQSLFSNISKSKQKNAKITKQKKKLLQLLKQKQLQDDLKNLDDILKDQTKNPAQQRKKRIFSIKQFQAKDKILGRMYNTSQRPALKLSQVQVDLFKLSKTGKKKSIINFTQEQKLQQFRQIKPFRGIYPSSNFQQF